MKYIAFGMMTGCFMATGATDRPASLIFIIIGVALSYWYDNEVIKDA